MDQFSPRAPGEPPASDESHPEASGTVEPAHGAPFPEQETLFPEHGTLFPAPGRTVEPDAVIALLRKHRLIAAVSAPEGPPLLGAARDFVVVTHADDRAIALDEQGRHLTSGPSLAALAVSIAEATGLGVDLGDLSLPPTQEAAAPVSAAAQHPPAVESRPGGVLLGALSAPSLPVLARRLGAPLEVWPLDFAGLPHHLVRAPSSGFHLHRFGAIDLPVLSLSRLGDAPYLSVLTAPGHLPGAFLSRTRAWLPTFTATDLESLDADQASTAHVVLAWFADPHRAPDSELMLLCTEPRPSTPLLADEFDPAVVSAALQSEEDEWWSHRVLSALGAPTLLSDVHEGRLDLGAPQVVEPSDPVRDALRARRRPLGHAGGPKRHRR